MVESSYTYVIVIFGIVVHNLVRLQRDGKKQEKTHSE